MFELAYLGTEFHGFAPQPGLRTVGGELAKVLGEATGSTPPALVCAGRTDKGVHALAQVVHVDLPRAASERPTEATKLCSRVRAALPKDIFLTRAWLAPQDFSARHDAISRRYRYLLAFNAAPSPFSRGLVWELEGELDIRLMEEASFALLGEHDFRAFCKCPSVGDAPSCTRRVLDVSLKRISSKDPGYLSADLLGTPLSGAKLAIFEIEANAFCHQMVRSIVGALVDIGRGRNRPNQLVAMLKAPRREGFPAPAPPDGLYLSRIRYSDVASSGLALVFQSSGALGGFAGSSAP